VVFLHKLFRLAHSYDGTVAPFGERKYMPDAYKYPSSRIYNKRAAQKGSPTVKRWKDFFDAPRAYFVLNHQSVVVALAYVMPFASTARTCQ
jgi:hypothetical protein